MNETLYKAFIRAMEDAIDANPDYDVDTHFVAICENLWKLLDANGDMEYLEQLRRDAELERAM